MDSIIYRIQHELDSCKDEQLNLSGKKYFKEEVNLRNIKVTETQKIGVKYFEELQDQPNTEILALCEKLWQTGYFEESVIACNWSYAIRKDYTPDDFTIFQRWIENFVSNWATCDTLCNHTVGTFLEMYPAYIAELKVWTTSPNRWMQRASAVSLIIPARKGLFLNEIFDIAEVLLLSKDDLVQKGYGWMLKAASEFFLRQSFRLWYNVSLKCHAQPFGIPSRKCPLK